MSLAASLANLRELVLNKINNFKATISEKDATISEKDATISEMKNYFNPWVSITASGTDALGDFEITNVDCVADNQIKVGRYIRLKSGFHFNVNAGEIGLPAGITEAGKSAIDMSGAEYVAADGGLAEHSFKCGSNLRRLLLPKKFAYQAIFESFGNMVGGLYLSKEWSGGTSGWITTATLDVEIPVKNPPDSNVPYYLHKIGISADDMVGIFNNMIDRSNETTTKYITLGETNLAKLTEEQKEIAYAKGWDLK